MNAGSIWISAGAISGFLSVAFGAFGAHGLRARLSADLLAVYQTGAQYQMYHALALVAFGTWLSRQPATAGVGLFSCRSITGWAFGVGTVLFSGSLYALALTGVRALGAITPLGGLAFMVGWIAFAVSAYSS